MGQTESICSRYRGLDTWSDEDILDAFWEGQLRAVAAVREARAALAEAARAMAGRLGEDGRIIYVGAGSSGRLGALDAVELGPTFGWPDERIVLLLAEGARLEPGLSGSFEDDAERGGAAMRALVPGASDVVIALAASGRTPFTCAAAEAAAEAGALVIAFANNADAPLFRSAGVAVLLDTGPEIISGSTRMGAGTAQKAALGLLSSLAMIRLGHVYDGLMVNLRVENAKLRERALGILTDITGCPQDAAARALDACGGRIKPAVLVAKGAAPSQADRLLRQAGGNLRKALGQLT
ncbi:N-acetylmuramic acid 6-phosphate etherase [Chelatococcus sp. SYSU_G07232]|uniref:N-acetylmuramic acid 6-phosphate etherase n=1 Tax=Chelatococcus albus TaxID=3047466 RepID=A0ABT7AHR5_9HYPH|nr:N-acetylmuramic acid 6-phosphate etherase [Chelatococcus sp. SYSU_G07232]MDJ1158171.1 N-acetylmuramic acid 6-phosphate etherase [Chelatococcus sp. SYSU_G07232]